MSAGLVGNSPAAIRPLYTAFNRQQLLHVCTHASERMWRAKQARLSHRVDRVGSLSLRVNCPLPPAQLTCRRRQVSSARKSPPTVFSRMRTNRIRHAISLSPTGGVYNAVLAGKALLYPHRRVGRCNVRRGERANRAAAKRLKSASCAANQHPRRISLLAPSGLACSCISRSAPRSPPLYVPV
jgi:hypothetical protein